MSLALVSRAMSSQSLQPGSADQHPPAGDDEEAREDRRSKLMRRGFVLLFAGIVFTILMGVGGDEARRLSVALGHLMNGLAGLGAAVLVAGAGMIVYAGLLPPLMLRQQSRRRAIAPPADTINYPDGRLDTASMEPQVQSNPSVTEHTTHTLGPDKSDPVSRQS
jgi:hypothetical protein